MEEETSIPTISYHYGYKNPGNFPGWYEFYAVSDGTVATPSNFDSLIRVWAEHLNSPENIVKKAVAYNKTPDAFEIEQIARIESMLNEHNERVSGLAAQISHK